ncbi:MAG: NAD-dependent epimerase/dehydratase family protein, partial [bacterium]
MLGQGHSVRAVDRKPLSDWYQVHAGAENVSADLMAMENAVAACDGATQVYQLAADMGGMGFIETHKAECMLSVITNTNMLIAARDAGAQRFFYSSSACVYNEEKQRDPNVTPLKEEDAYPAMPEDGYGWEKLFSERMCRHFRE